MRKYLAHLLAVVILTLPGLATGADLSSPLLDPDADPDPDAMRDVVYLYDSPLIVWEEIVDLGGGQYQYTYRFENVDSANIWHFGVWTMFGPIESISTWLGHDAWVYSSGDIIDIYPAYDGRNLNPDIVFVANTWGPNWPDTDDPIVPGEYVEGFSYVGDYFDDSPKWYFYETIESGYAGDTGFVAAVGLTGSVVANEARTLGQIRALYR